MDSTPGPRNAVNLVQKEHRLVDMLDDMYSLDIIERIIFKWPGVATVYIKNYIYTL